MATKQTRRTISLSGRTYARLRNLCERSHISMAGLMEKLANEHCERCGEPEVEKAPVHEPKAREVELPPSSIWTF